MAVSYDKFTGDGSTVDFNITFEYLEESDIYVKINDIANTDWTLSTATKVTFDSAPAVDDEILIFRATDISSMDAVFAPGSAIRAKDLNDDFDQLRLAIQENVDGVEVNGDAITIIEGDIIDIKEDITVIEGDITALDARVTKNEADIAVIQGDISDIEGDVSGLETRVSANETNIASNKTTIDNLTTVVDDHEGRITQNESDIAALQGDVQDLEDNPYTLPIASASTLGGVKVGTNLSITADGTLNASGGGGGGGAVDSVNGSTGDVVLTASDVGALASGDDVSELNNDAGYITLAEVPPGGVTSVNTKTGDVVLDASDVGALDSIDAGLGISVTGNQVKLDNGTGIEFDGNKARIGDLEQLKNVVVTGANQGDVIKWNDSLSQWENSPEIPVEGALVFQYPIDAVTTYPPANLIIPGNFWVTTSPDQGEPRTNAAAQWTTVDMSVDPYVEGPVLQVKYGDMIAIGAEHTLQNGTTVRNHVVFGNVDNLLSIGLQPGDNVSLLTNDAGYITASDIPPPPTVGNGALTIKTAGQEASATGTFTANQSGASTLTLPAIRYQDVSGTPSIPAAANNGQININGGDGITASGSNATANQSGNTTRTLAIDTTWLQTWVDDNAPTPTVGNGALTIQTAGEGASSTGTYRANQSGNSTLTLPTIRYQDLSGRPSIPSAPKNGQINVNPGVGILATGSNATADQSANTTRTLAVQVRTGAGVKVDGNGVQLDGNWSMIPDLPE